MNSQQRAAFRLASLLLPLVAAAHLNAQPARPPLPQSRPEHLDPDRDTCRPDRIRQHVQAQLLPWQDQPAAVLSELRKLQAEMTLASLRRCVQRGLMTRQEATQVASDLQLLPSTRP